ncbi:spore coat protein [Candidatus Woesebacteria bacterium RIFCSPHIGHO2_12_FULL_46_16]|uniref:glucose-1-phosphate thymidylyltransferase n=1 Tax=Candidatus Woesebacteria bacterium RIFCSPHIGHO2_12_FULL_46_16 TaxID=1802513 RepID=A0A1F8B292_9BACT|nr:MAG: spore coat protein [Candidatus Woesebacteria bacterium RIFCSPHIGHO2_12_FULL_46_16]
MKGVILAGGLATRLYPLTHATNKHLLPVYDKPMIFYPIEALLDAGIKEILIVTGGPHAGDFIRVLKDGKELGVNHLEYTYQERPDGGIADALALAKDFADGGPIAVILGDNTTDADIKSQVQSFKDGALVFVKKVADPERYGVPVFDKTGKKILKIEEKPKKPKSEYAVTGLYLYDNSVFDIVKTIKPSQRGQLEITDVNNAYLKKGKLRWAELEGFWTDAGTPASLFKANMFWAVKKGVNLL